MAFIEARRSTSTPSRSVAAKAENDVRQGLRATWISHQTKHEPPDGAWQVASPAS